MFRKDCKSFILKGFSPWDVAEGRVILYEVGGIASRNIGARINKLDKEMEVICNNVLHEKVIVNYLSEWENNSQTYMNLEIKETN